jgi:hypothetical protein
MEQVSMIEPARAHRRGASAPLLLVLLSVAGSAAASVQTPNLLTKDVVQRQMRLYCRVSPEHRCVAPARARVGMFCRCYVQLGQSGRVSRPGRVVREPSFIRNRP